MEITGYEVESLEDPFGLLAGERYEYLLNIEVDEEDELYREQGLSLRVIYRNENGDGTILQYHFIDRASGKVIDFALEEDEETQVISYCKQHLPE
nr:DUF6509 family protein [Mesobacillus harenae]